MIKKFAVLFMTVALAVGAVVPSYANTYDKNYAFTVSAKHYVTPAFSKDGTTKVYAYYTVGPYRLAFQTWGTNSGNSSGANCTSGETARVTRDVKSSITNFIHEQGYAKAYLKINAYDESGVGVRAEGVWSLDSTRNYNVVN